MPKVILAAALVFFAIYFNTLVGIAATSTELVSALRLMGASRFTIFRKAVLPNAVPYILIAMRITLPAALIGAIIGEFISSNRGIGDPIAEASSSYDTAQALAGIFSLVAFVLVLNAGVTMLERKLLRCVRPSTGWCERHVDRTAHGDRQRIRAGTDGASRHRRPERLRSSRWMVREARVDAPSLRHVIPMINTLIAAARRTGATVAYVAMQHGPEVDAPNYQARYAARGMADAILCRRGTWARRSMTSYRARGRRYRRRPAQLRRLCEDRSRKALEGRGVETCIATGVVTNLCVQEDDPARLLPRLLCGLVADARPRRRPPSTT